jgi:hypothetical protein
MLKEKRKKKDESLSASPADPLGLVFRRHDDHWDRLQRAQRLQTSNEAMSQSHIRLAAAAGHRRRLWTVMALV